MKSQEDLSTLYENVVNKKKKLAVITCEVLARELYYATLINQNIIHLEFKTKGLHDNPETMRKELQEEVDKISFSTREKFMAILLGYGLCSNGTMGIKARNIPIIIPRAHDCITLFLGSKERYSEEFTKYPGTYYFTTGWVERGKEGVERSKTSGYGLGKTYEEYVALYGEDNARYLYELENSWSMRYNQATYIDMHLPIPFTYEKEVEKEAERLGWSYRKIDGDMKLFHNLLDGRWDENDFLIVPPGYSIQPSYDRCILKIEPANE
ncbi:MAG: DUF1638 domain-containing protein [bacterium]